MRAETVYETPYNTEESVLDLHSMSKLEPRLLGINAIDCHFDEVVSTAPVPQNKTVV